MNIVVSCLNEFILGSVFLLVNNSIMHGIYCLLTVRWSAPYDIYIFTFFLKCIVFYRSFIVQGVLVSLVCDIKSKFLFDMTKLLNIRVNKFLLAAMNYETAGTMIYCRIQLFALLTLMVFYKQVFYMNIWFEMGAGVLSSHLDSLPNAQPIRLTLKLYWLIVKNI